MLEILGDALRTVQQAEKFTKFADSIAVDNFAGDFDRIELYPKQAAIVDDSARFTITEATTKAGKTASHIEWLLERAAYHRSGNVWWVATVHSTAEMAMRRTMERLRGFIDSGGELKQVSEPIPFTKNESKGFIDVFGCRIWFKSAEKPDNLYGEDVRDAVGDEVTRWRESAWTALYTTLTATKGKAKLIGNVKGRRNWAYKIARKAEAGEPNWSYHKLTALDAIEGGVIEQGIVDQAKRDLPETIFNELYMAIAGDDQGNPFGLRHISEAISPLHSTTPVAFGVDLAKSIDYTVIIGLDEGGSICHYQRFNQVPWAQQKKIILEAIGDTPTMMDSTGVGDPITEELQQVAPNIEGFKFTSSSKQQLMEAYVSAIQQGKTTVLDNEHRVEMESFEYEYTRTGVRYSAPQGMHDDTVMGAALAWRCYSTARMNVPQIRML